MITILSSSPLTFVYISVTTKLLSIDKENVTICVIHLANLFVTPVDSCYLKQSGSGLKQWILCLRYFRLKQFPFIVSNRVLLDQLNGHENWINYYKQVSINETRISSNRKQGPLLMASWGMTGEHRIDRVHNTIENWLNCLRQHTQLTPVTP